ncbi:MAG: hypothetical protein HY905_03925 [Deltaproteobacteria bacterium]|nr:hypothetical protein [Deltaproteobacteria bacterium]
MLFREVVRPLIDLEPSRQKLDWRCTTRKRRRRFEEMEHKAAERAQAVLERLLRGDADAGLGSLGRLR